MTTKLSAPRFRTRPPEPREPLPRPVLRPVPTAAPLAAGDEEMPFASRGDDGFGAEPFATARGRPTPHAAAETAAIRSPLPPALPAAEAGPEIDAIRREGLTGRQLRMARRLAEKHGLPATSDFDAVRLLRRSGIDPFQKSSVLDLVAGTVEATPNLPAAGDRDGVRLPQTNLTPAVRLPSTELRAEAAHVAEVARIQQDIARRRRRRLTLLAARLAVFIALPTAVAGWYYSAVATPMYAAKTEFQIQTADPAASAGLGGLLASSPLGSSKDSIAVQGYLQSQEAMERLDAEAGFRAHFSAPAIDMLQRLEPGASNSQTYETYQDHVRISFDPTEGIVKMEVSAADPALAVQFSRALLTYAEEQVDQMTDRLRADQMKGAQESYDEAEAKMLEAQRRVVELQEKFKVLSSEVEVGLITTQIGTLESQLTQDKLSLAQMESNASPNAARMEPLKRRIATLEDEIAQMRAKLTEDGQGGLSIAKVQSELLVAQADVQTRQLLLAQSLQAMETARIEANRQTRYLTVSVNPVTPDEAAYPRAFENTLVVLLIFTGLYLMVSMTLAILREQVAA